MRVNVWINMWIMSSLKRACIFLTFLIVTGWMKSFSGLHRLKTRIHASGPEGKVVPGASQIASAPLLRLQPIRCQALLLKVSVDVSLFHLFKAHQIVEPHSKYSNHWKPPEAFATADVRTPQPSRNRQTRKACSKERAEHRSSAASLVLGIASQDADPVGYCWPAALVGQTFCCALHPSPMKNIETCAKKHTPQPQAVLHVLHDVNKSGLHRLSLSPMVNKNLQNTDMHPFWKMGRTSLKTRIVISERRTRLPQT